MLPKTPKYSILVYPKKEFSILHLNPFFFCLFSFNSNLCTWSIQSTFFMVKSSSIYAQIISNSWNESFIFCWKMSGEFPIAIVRRLWQYFTKGIIIIHKLLVFLISQILYYFMFKSSDVAYWKPSKYNNISLV